MAPGDLKQAIRCRQVICVARAGMFDRQDLRVDLPREQCFQARTPLLGRLPLHVLPAIFHAYDLLCLLIVQFDIDPVAGLPEQTLSMPQHVNK